jgi:hypothetical protein
MRVSVFAFSVSLAAILTIGQVVAAKHTWVPARDGALGSSDESGMAQAPAPKIIVIGFVGGYVRHDDAVHSGVQLAARIRGNYPSSAYINTFENHRGEQAHQAVLRALDANQDDHLSADEKRSARIVIYGHSWGASETVALADALDRDGISVLLTIQVDSVMKRGEDDSLIPPNVAQAVNYYQTDGRLHGRSEIRAAEPARTHIIGNFRVAYGKEPMACEAAYPWWDRLVMQPHIEIECDPKVWHQVESLIRAALPPPPAHATTEPNTASELPAMLTRNPAQ